jgi:hypothetical protein
VSKAGSRAAMSGMSRGPNGLVKLMTRRSEYLNAPRVGDASNVCFPTFQLNVASAAERDDSEYYPRIDQEDLKVTSLTYSGSPGTTLDASLGRYGTIHPDCGDSACSVTGMTCLSKPHPDVDPDIFFIQDYGIAIEFQEFDVLYFCGLHLHGGSQPTYRKERTTDKPYTRLTLIAYPPSKFFDDASSSAFASLPGNPGVMKIYNEMKDFM